MAVSIQVTSIAANPQKIANVSKTAAAVGRALKVYGRSLSRKLSSQKPFVWIKRQATPREVEQVKALVAGDHAVEHTAGKLDGACESQ